MSEPTKPTLLVIAGPTGSGKTAVTHRMVDRSWFRDLCLVDPDAIVASLPGGFRAHTNAPRAALAAGRRRYQALAAGQVIVCKTVFAAHADPARFVRAARDKGCRTHLLFVATRDPAINAYRVARRYMEGGHPIPVDTIVDRYYRSMTNLSRSLADFDLVHILDNSVDARAPALECVADNTARRLWLADSVEDWVRVATAGVATVRRPQRAGAPTLPPYFSP